MAEEGAKRQLRLRLFCSLYLWAFKSIPAQYRQRHQRQLKVH